MQQLAVKTQPDPQPWWRHWSITVLRVVVGVSALAIGLGVMALAVVLGDCSAFGGRCPSDPSFDADTLRFAALGAALAVGVPMFVLKPTRRRLATSVVSSLIAAILVGTLVTAIAA